MSLLKNAILLFRPKHVGDSVAGLRHHHFGAGQIVPKEAVLSSGVVGTSVDVVASHYFRA